MFRPRQREETIFLSLGYEWPGSLASSSQELRITNSWPRVSTRRAATERGPLIRLRMRGNCGEPKHGCFPGSCCSCPQEGVANSPARIWGHKIQSSIPLPQPQLIRKIWNFQFIFESGFGYVTQADLELASILLPHPLAVITGRNHHTPGILYNFTTFCSFCFVFPPVKALGVLKETEWNPHSLLLGTKVQSLLEKQSSSCSKSSAELSRDSAALHTRPTVSTQKPVCGVHSGGVGVTPKGPSAEEAEYPGTGKREGKEHPLMLRQEYHATRQKPVTESHILHDCFHM